MKIIDLIKRCLERDNTLPKKIKYKGNEYHFSENTFNNPHFYYGLLEDIRLFSDLNEEVEIIKEEDEEDTKIHKLNKTRYITGATENESKLLHYYTDLENKLGEVIDAVNRLGGKNE